MEIVLENIIYSSNSKLIINDVTMNIKTNSITGIVGKSGSGKTSLLEIIDNLIIPQSGNIKRKNSTVGMVFQFCEEQFFCNTVAKEIAFGISYKEDKEKIEKRVLDSLRMVDLAQDYLNRNPFTLSNGEKRKVAIASILALNPNVLILDEPTVGLDSKSVDSLVKIIKMLKNRYNKTIILCSNDTEFIHRICDEVFVLNDGKIVLTGNKYEVFSSDIEQYGIKKPKIIEFENLVLKEKGIKLLYRDDINDLMKDVYRSVK